jgi:hypothetical protein
MNSSSFLASMISTVILLPVIAHAQYRSSITFQNDGTQAALVKLVGPSARTVAVPTNEGRSESGIAPGRYHIVVRYGDAKGHYTYVKGDPFEIEKPNGLSQSELYHTIPFLTLGAPWEMPSLILEPTQNSNCQGGDMLTIWLRQAPSTEYSEFSIVLYKVANNNYRSRPASKEEFEKPQ